MIGGFVMKKDDIKNEEGKRIITILSLERRLLENRIKNVTDWQIKSGIEDVISSITRSIKDFERNCISS